MPMNMQPLCALGLSAALLYPDTTFASTQRSGLCIQKIPDVLAAVTSIDLGANGHELLVAAKNNVNSLWDLRMLKCIKRLNGHNNMSKNFIRAR